MNRRKASIAKRASDANEPDLDDEVSGGDGQRLDKWLWYARVVKSRSLAQGLIEGGRVRLNKVKVDKARQIVKPDDVLTITIHHKVRILKVVLPGTRRGPATEAQTLYEDLTPPERQSGDDLAGGTQAGSSAVGVRERGASRPTKRDRRRLDEFRGRDS